MTSTDFHDLKILDIRQDTEDAVIVSFELPASLRATYRFEPGQHLTLRALVEGNDLRRTYSICSGEDEDLIFIGVRRVRGGAFSNWLHEQAKPGLAIAVMPPQGRFCLKRTAPAGRHYLGIAGGSGITPILSILKSVLVRDPRSHFTLLYGNRSQKSTMFKEEIEDLKNRYMTRLVLHHVFSREQMDAPLNSGRLNREKIAEFLGSVIDPAEIDQVYICGPNDMNDEAGKAVLAAGIGEDKVHVERYGVPVAHSTRDLDEPDVTDELTGSRLLIIRDGLTREIEFRKGDKSVLDAAAHAGLDVPFSCKAGVCATCRAKLLEGDVRMTRNFALERSEIESGFILTCQAHPLTPRVVVSFDER
jgi:ring-1,2-phenylacetyl-CoA epoxidase subunit PaaE